MRDDAYEGVPGVFDLVRGKARGMTEKQIYAAHSKRVADERSAKTSLRDERTAVKDYKQREAAAASPELKKEYARIRKDEGEHAATFQRESKKLAAAMDRVKALLPLLKEPALLAAIAAPVVGFGVNELSRERQALQAAKAKAETYRTMMELVPRLRNHDQKEIGRLYNTLHNVNPMMGNDPLVAGAWIDNIMENKQELGSESSNQALLTAVKDLSGIRSSLSQALRNEQHPSIGNKWESFISGVGKDLHQARHRGIDEREKAVRQLWDERERGFNELVKKKAPELGALLGGEKKASVSDLSAFFHAAGIA